MTPRIFTADNKDTAVENATKYAQQPFSYYGELIIVRYPINPKAIAWTFKLDWYYVDDKTSDTPLQPFGTTMDIEEFRTKLQNVEHEVTEITTTLSTVLPNFELRLKALEQKTGINYVFNDQEFNVTQTQQPDGTITKTITLKDIPTSKIHNDERSKGEYWILDGNIEGE